MERGSVKVELKFQAFDLFYQKHVDMIYRIAMHYMKHNASVEDILQEVFLRYFTLNLAEQMSEEHQKAWLIRVTINLCKDACKSSWNKKRESFEDYLGCTSNGMNTESERELYQMIYQLPGDSAALLILHYIYGYTLAETAKLLGYRLTTAASKINRAKKQLKMVLEA